MKALIQRSTGASVTVDGQEIGAIGPGLVVLLGVTNEDSEKDIDFLVNKIVNLRLFKGDGASEFDRSVLEEQKEVLVVSQFTLYGSCNKGRRPDFNEAARPEISEPLYDKFVEKMIETGLTVATGQFGADMKVALTNDGPVTLMIESKSQD
jgi:D-tyrosyl-tRNA(Tyr) deacylase